MECKFDKGGFETEESGGSRCLLKQEVAKLLKLAVGDLLRQKDLNYLVGAAAGPKRPFVPIAVTVGKGGHPHSERKNEVQEIGTKAEYFLLPTEVVVVVKFVADANNKIVHRNLPLDNASRSNFWRRVFLDIVRIMCLGEGESVVGIVIWVGHHQTDMGCSHYVFVLVVMVFVVCNWSGDGLVGDRDRLDGWVKFHWGSESPCPPLGEEEVIEMDEMVRWHKVLGRGIGNANELFLE
ncbi:hypothetical protein ACLOJK_036995 [Asimina triloba]